MFSFKNLNAYWESKKGTRLGQACGLAGLGLLLGLLAAAKVPNLSIQMRAGMAAGMGVAMAVALLLVMLVPSIWLERIKKKQERGESVTAQRVLLVLYFFPFLTFLSIGILAAVMSRIPL